MLSLMKNFFNMKPISIIFEPNTKHVIDHVICDVTTSSHLRVIDHVICDVTTSSHLRVINHVMGDVTTSSHILILESLIHKRLKVKQW